MALRYYKRFFVFGIKNALKLRHRVKTKLLLTNKTTWHERQLTWQFVFSGFYFDELFAKIIKRFSTAFMILPSFFIFDKFFSAWTGSKIFKNSLSFFNNCFYVENFNPFSMFITLILGIPVFGGLFYIIIIFLL